MRAGASKDVHHPGELVGDGGMRGSPRGPLAPSLDAAPQPAKTIENLLFHTYFGRKTPENTVVFHQKWV